jgi:hypothetical protein
VPATGERRSRGHGQGRGLARARRAATEKGRERLDPDQCRAARGKASLTKLPEPSRGTIERRAADPAEAFPNRPALAEELRVMEWLLVIAWLVGNNTPATVLQFETETLCTQARDRVMRPQPESPIAYPEDSERKRIAFAVCVRAKHGPVNASNGNGRANGTWR